MPRPSTAPTSGTSSGTIKLPLILPTLGVVAILTFVGNFNAFDLIYTIKGALAGPNFATDILGTFFYRTFFGYQLQLGSPTMGATVATDDAGHHPGRRPLPLSSFSAAASAAHVGGSEAATRSSTRGHGACTLNSRAP